MNSAAPQSIASSITADVPLQSALEKADASLRTELAMAPQQTSAGVIDLRRSRSAMLRADRLFYGASVPKIVILAAYFEYHPAASRNLDPTTRHELGLMIKKSSNDLAAKYSQLIGLDKLRAFVEKHGFYDAHGGGGLWVGKHYGVTGERIGDPIADHSHAVTTRQLLRFYLMLDRGELVSREACDRMKEIFASPEIEHDENRFVLGLKGRERQIFRKSGWWENWLHDTALISGGGRHYILVGLTEHQRGDDYLKGLASRMDDHLA